MPSIRKNIAYTAILRVSSVIFPIITIPYVSRVLGAEQIGAVNYAIDYAFFFVSFAMLGIPLYGIREIAKCGEDTRARSKLFSELFTINLLSTLFCTAIYVASILLIPQLYKDRTMLLASGLLLYTCSFSVDWFFQGRENFRMITLRSVSVKSLALVAMFVWVRTRQDALIYLVIVVLSTVAGHAWNMTCLLRREVKISFRNLLLRPHVRPLLALLASSIAISVYAYLNTIMLGFISTEREVGYYTSAYKISSILIPMVTAVGMVLLPRLSLSFKTGDSDTIHRLLDRGFSFVAFIAVPLALGVSLTADSFVPLFFGDDFLGAITPMRIVSLLILVVALAHVFAHQVLIASGDHIKYTLATFLGMMISIPLNLLLIPRYASTGASITMVAVNLSVLSVVLHYAYKAFDLRLPWGKLSKAALCCLPFIAVYLCLPTPTNWGALSLFIVLAGISYGVLQQTIFKNEFAEEFCRKLSSLLKRQK